MPASQTLQLFPDQPQRLDAAHGTELYVGSGIVWITADDAGDMFFSAGERCRLPTAGIVLAEALRGEATVRLEPVETLSSDNSPVSVKSALVVALAAALAWPRARRRPYRPLSGGTAC
jgi:hypothetical protein